MNRSNVYFQVTARLDYRESFNWYYVRSPRAAGLFKKEVERAIETIIESPETWPLYEGVTRRFVLRKFPFSIVYWIVDDGIEIVAIAHNKRRPGYWGDR
jgi:toxin ParE1/3/4